MPALSGGKMWSYMQLCSIANEALQPGFTRYPA